MHGLFVIPEFAGDLFFRQSVIERERRFVKSLDPKWSGFELIPHYAIRGGVVQRVGRRRAKLRYYD